MRKKVFGEKKSWIIREYRIRPHIQCQSLWEPACTIYGHLNILVRLNLFTSQDVLGIALDWLHFFWFQNDFARINKMQVRVLGFIHGQGRQSDKRGYYPLSINFRIFNGDAVIFLCNIFAICGTKLWKRTRTAFLIPKGFNRTVVN